MRIYALLADSGILEVKDNTVKFVTTPEKESLFLTLCFDLLDTIHDALEMSNTEVLEKVLQDIKKSEESEYSKAILTKINS
jgi:hypothetical protein